MWIQKVFVISVSLVFVISEAENRNGGSRKPRLFTFNAVDEDVTVNLEFSIPFLTIPAKKAIQSTFGIWDGDFPTLNINPASLAVGGAVVLGTSVLVPLLLKSYALQYPHQQYSRLLDSSEFSTDAILRFAGEMLSDGKSVRGCALRVACWSAQMATEDASNAWSQVMSNTLLSSMINVTAIEDAMMSGKHGRDCYDYTPCPLRHEHFPILINNIHTIARSFGS